MTGLPTIIATSVVRGAQKGESHGGLYLVNLEEGSHTQVVDWATLDIEWEASGRDRGLRGISFYKGSIYIASSGEILVLNKEFQVIDRFRCGYMRMCHEIDICGDKLYITSTTFDSILVYDLLEKSFVCGYRIDYENKFPRVRVFDPNREGGPSCSNLFHINNVSVADGEILFSGLKTNVLFGINDQDSLQIKGIIPIGTHNVKRFRDGLLMNDTPNNNILYTNKTSEFRYNIKKYSEDDLFVPEGDYVARQQFGRGLTTWENCIIGGSSPGTISLYEVGNPDPVRTVNFTMDIRNSIHGLEVWPFTEEE